MAAGPLRLADRLAIDAGVSFGEVAGLRIVFSAPTQRMFELNETAAYIWRGLEEGMTPEGIAARLVALDVPADTAEAYVRASVSRWRRLGLLRPVPCGSDDDPAEPELSAVGRVPLSSNGDGRDHSEPGEPAIACRDLGLAGLRIRISYPSAALERLVAPVFRNLEIAAGQPDLMLSIEDRRPDFRLMRGRTPVVTCSSAEIVPALKGQLMSELLEHGAYELAFHAAFLVHERQALLLSGAPGTGKTTLAAALWHAGFAYGGDDVALMTPDGQVVGVPFAPTLKVGAWRLLESCRPDLKTAPVFRRLDGRRVRYLSSSGPLAADPAPLRWLVLLHRRSRCRAVLEQVSPVEGMRRILAGAFAPDHRLSKAAFAGLARMMSGAACYRLTYDCLDDAVEQLKGACR